MARIGDLIGFPLHLSWNYFYAIGVPRDWWGACKVIGKREDLWVVASLDWFGQGTPTADEVAERPVLVAPAWPHINAECPAVQWRVELQRPREFVKLGNCAPTAADLACIEPIRSGGGWGGLWAVHCAIWRWRNDRAALEAQFRRK